MRGGFFFIDNEAQEEALERFGSFTVMRDYGVWGMYQVALLVGDGGISEAGTLSDARTRVTGQRGLRYLRGIELWPPVASTALRNEVPSRLRVVLNRHRQIEGRLPNSTWKAIVDALVRLDQSPAPSFVPWSRPQGWISVWENRILREGCDVSRRRDFRRAAERPLGIANYSSARARIVRGGPCPRTGPRGSHRCI